MAVNEEGEIHGSIGGGIMEYKFVELAKSKLNEAALEASVHHQVHDKVAAKNQSGMICSGEQTLFLYTVQFKDRGAIEALVNSLEANKHGALGLTSSGIHFSNEVPSPDYSLGIMPDGRFSYLEKTGYKNYLNIIGAGHCALALARLMSSMDFYIRVFDDRPNLDPLTHNEYVHETTLLKDYEDLTTLVPAGKNCFTVIMTVGYRTDEIALKSLLRKDFTYIGILGSKSKIDKLMKNLVEGGISTELLKKVHAPIGVPIKSQTPEEIAVSIAAEIIREKNRDLG